MRFSLVQVQRHGLLGHRGWSLRKAAHTLGLEHVRGLRWLDRAAQDPAG
jgi:hypothetical protein